jgi:Holliday junction resolvasome RuvABC endonuclease subunit
VNPDVLTLDLGSTTGWAASYGGAVMSGEETFRGNLDRRLGAFLLWLRPRMPETFLVVESPFVLYRSAAASIYGMHGVARALAAEFGVEFVQISPSEVKRHATGKAHATKEEVLQWAMRWGKPIDLGRTNVTSEHEADALALLSCWQTRDFKVKRKPARKGSKR